MTDIPLVIATPTGECERSLRRFRWSSAEPKCSDGGRGCDASVVIESRVLAPIERMSGDTWPHSDSRWPTACVTCNRPFDDTDQWQRNDSGIYRRNDGVEFVFRGAFGNCAPPGTICRAEWADQFFSARHPQRVESWIVSLPDGGEWITSQSATGGGHWTVTGTPPNITVSPSIHHNAPTGWHGFIRSGSLVAA